MHEGGFDCRRSKDGEIYFLDRQSRPIADSPSPRYGSLENPIAWMYRNYADKDVTAETSVAKWYAGEQMDWEHAIWLMFAMEPHSPQ